MLKEKTQYEFDKLHETVNEVFNVRMLTKSRERKNINARICFAHLLVDRGYSKSEVARYMEKNHANHNPLLQKLLWVLKIRCYPS